MATVLDHVDLDQIRYFLIKQAIRTKQNAVTKDHIKSILTIPFKYSDLSIKQSYAT